MDFPRPIRKVNSNLEIIAKVLNSNAKKYGCRIKYKKSNQTIYFYGNTSYQHQIVEDCLSLFLKTKGDLLDTAQDASNQKKMNPPPLEDSKYNRTNSSYCIELIVEKYRDMFRCPENTNYYNKNDYKEAEIKFVKFCLDRKVAILKKKKERSDTRNRRSGFERRSFIYAMHIPERRSKHDRRATIDLKQDQPHEPYWVFLPKPSKSPVGKLRG